MGTVVLTVIHNANWMKKNIISLNNSSQAKFLVGTPKEKSAGLFNLTKQEEGAVLTGWTGFKDF